MEQVKNVPEYIWEMYKGNYFMEGFGISIDEIHNGSAVVSLEIDPLKHFNHRGVCHGGVLIALADAVLGVTGASVGAKVATLSTAMNFIRPITKPGRIYVRSQITHHGRTTITMDSCLYDNDDKLAGTVTNVMFVLERFQEIPAVWSEDNVITTKKEWEKKNGICNQ
ncbi:MAG: PaaI family thioesterase [Phascolarctobacterium sp.]|nr:PaaI family thioesterase [Phascolarctobacterium sp.]